MAPAPTAPPGWSAIKVGNEVFFWPTSQPAPTSLNGTHTFSEPPNFRIPDGWGKQPPPEWHDLYGAANRAKDVNPFEVLASTPPPPPPPPPPPGAPPANPPGNDGGNTPDDPQQGEGTDAAKKLEDSLKKVNTKVAEADRTLAEAVLNAHSNTVAGKQKLANIQQAISDAVTRQPALDTQLGAREFSKFLLSKQKDILDVVSSADLDDKSKTAILAGLGYLNGAAAGDDGPDRKPDDKDKEKDKEKDKQSDNSGSNNGTNGGNTGGGGGDAPPAAPAGPTGPGNDAGTDPLSSLLSDPGLLGGDGGAGANPLSNLASGLPSMMPQMPSMGGGGLGGLPGLLGGGGGDQGGNGLADALNKPNHHSDDTTLKSLLDPSNSPDPTHSGDPSGGKPDSPLDPAKHDDKPGDKPSNENPTPGTPVPAPLAPPVPPGSGPTQVQLPNGQTVTAPNPQMANVTKLIAQGTPIADAFHQNGMSWPPPPGTPVHTPTDPSRITMGSVGQFADHQVYAINKDLVVINGQIKPIAAASGPGFLGWMAPPDVPTTTNPTI